MAYDDIKISELPEIRVIEDDDSLVINDATNNLTYRVDWRDLKNSIGTLSEGIIFPLGEIREPSVAIGDYTSGIYGRDFGTFHIVTHGRDRYVVNQAGTQHLINGHVVIGNYDRACFYTLTVNNITTFHCLVNMEGGLHMPGIIIEDGNITIDGDLIVGGDVELGTDCDSTITIHGQLIAECDFKLIGNLEVDSNITGKGDLVIEGDVTLGSGCEDKLQINSETTIECDTHIKGDLTVDGEVNLNTQKGEINIGDPTANCGDLDIHLNGNVDVKCDFEVNGDSHFHGNVDIDKDLNVNGNVNIGSGGCDQGEVIIDAPTHINCDLSVDGNLTVNGEGPIIIGPPGGGNNLLPCSEQADCPNGTLCYAGFCFPLCDINDPTSCPDGNCQTVTIDGFDYHICVPNPVPIDCDNAPDIDLNGNVNVSCDLTVGGDTHLNGNLEVDGGLTIGKPGAECDESPVEIHGDTDISCDLNVEGDTHLNNTIISGPEIIIGGPQGPGPGGWCPNGNECPNGYECIDGRCEPIKCEAGCPPGTICVNGICLILCNTVAACPPNHECETVNIGGQDFDVCLPENTYDCDNAPDIDLNGNVNVSCDLVVGGDIYYQGGVLSGGNVSLGEKCDDVVEIKGTLINRCDVNCDENLRVLEDTELGSGCQNTVKINATLNVGCDATFTENVDIFKDITIRDGDLTVNGGVINGDGSGIYNLNIPGSLRFKGSWNAGDPPPSTAVQVGDFYLNNCGDFTSAEVEVDAGWGFAHNDAYGNAVSPTGTLLAALNQHMIYTVDGIWQLGSIVNSSGYVTLDTRQTITQTKNFDHNVIDSSGSFDVIVPERTIELRHDYGVYARDYAINELNAIPRKP